LQPSWQDIFCACHIYQDERLAETSIDKCWVNKQINAGMMRALEAFQEAILMVDTTNPECWSVLHVNKTFVEQTGAVLCGISGQ
jgi:hypothetical protein